MKKLILAVAFCLIAIGCTPVEENARNTAAALNGAITTAQAKYLTSCQSDQSLPVCQDIDKAVAAQNALITAIETYCTLPQGSPADSKCMPVKSAEPALETAIANAGQFITELKGVIQ